MLRRWERRFSRFGPLDWLGFCIPCVSWLREYSWADDLLVRPPAFLGLCTDTGARINPA